MSRLQDPALIHLASADSIMGRQIALHGPAPRTQSATEPFEALTRAIVYQQLTGRAAGTILERLHGLFGGKPPEPRDIAGSDDDALRAVGLSRQKVAALRDLAAHAQTGELSRHELEQRSDDDAISHLIRIRGVGRWTAEMYLIDCGRPDILPVADLGLNKAIMRLYGLQSIPEPPTVRLIGEAWRPYASTACWYLWRSYDGPPAS